MTKYANVSSIRYWLAQIAISSLFFFLLPTGMRAQSVTTTIAAGSEPYATAINPVTNTVYVTNYASSNVTAIDGRTNSTTTIAVGTSPASVAVNTATNKIYVANAGSNTVTVIDGTNNITATVTVGSTPISVAINSLTNKIYVANSGGNNITVINGINNSTETIAAGTTPVSVAVNPVTNNIYVANNGNARVTVINGVNNSSTATVLVGSHPNAVAVNPITNLVYVANYGGNTVTVIDGTNNSTTSITGGSNPYAVAVNPVTNKIYVSNYSASSVMVIDGASNSATNVATGKNPGSVVVNTKTNQIYIANRANSSVTVLDGATNKTVTLAGGSQPYSMAVNPVTATVYVANFNSADITVIDGATYNTTVVTLPASDPNLIDINPLTNKVYVASEGDGVSDFGSVAVIDGATNVVTSIAVRASPTAIAVNAVTNKVYVANGFSSTVTVIDGATNSTSVIAMPGLPGSIVVNQLTNLIYVSIVAPNGGNSRIVVIDGTSNRLGTIATMTTGGGFGTLAINPITNKLYSVNFDTVSVIDCVVDSITNIPIPASTWGIVAVDPVTNKVYVAGDAPVVTIIDGRTNAAMAVPVEFGGTAMAINSLTNKIYIAADSNTVTVIDGATNNATTLTFRNPGIPSIPGIQLLAVDQIRNKIYVGATGSIAVIDGITNSTTQIAGGGSPVALNPVTNKLYVCGDTTVAVIDEQQSPVPLTTSITPIAGNQTDQADPSFTLTAHSSTVTTPNAIYYQVDTGQNAWKAATVSNLTYTATLSSLQPGFHSLYAFAVDGQETTSTQVGSPLTGAIQAYGFFINTPSQPPPPLSVSPNSGSGTAQIFTGVYPETNGTATLTILRMLFTKRPFSTANACYVLYYASSNLMYLENDAGTGLSAGITPGVAGQVSNSQCTLKGIGSSVSVSVNSATLTAAVTFNETLLAPTNIYLAATDIYQSSTGWILNGNWGMSDGPATAVSLLPASGSGATQIFTSVYADPNGAGDIQTARMLFNTGVIYSNACYVSYYSASNLLYLENDTGTGLTSGVTPGSASQVSNSQCTLTGTGSSISITGDNLTVNVALTFSAHIVTPVNVYLATTQNAWPQDKNANSGWILKGTWAP